MQRYAACSQYYTNFRSDIVALFLSMLDFALQIVIVIVIFVNLILGGSISNYVINKICYAVRNNFYCLRQYVYGT